MSPVPLSLSRALRRLRAGPEVLPGPLGGFWCLGYAALRCCCVARLSELPLRALWCLSMGLRRCPVLGLSVLILREHYMVFVRV